MSEPLCDYELITVTYGVKSSPFQAIRLVHKLEDDTHNYKSILKILSTQTYVDDVISQHDTILELLNRQAELTQLLVDAGFAFKKWSSNCEVLMNQIPLENQAPQISFDLKDELSIKILGLH